MNTNAPDAWVDRMVAENGSYYLIGYSSPAPPNDGRHHRITVRTHVPGVEIRAREGYDSPGRPPKAVAGTPLDALSRVALQTGGLTMRVVAIPAPLATEPAAAVLVGIELPTALATKAGRIEFAVSAIDGDGTVRARTRFTTNFSAAEKTAAAWTRTGSGLTSRLVTTRSAWRRSAPINRRAASSWTSRCRGSMPSLASEDCRWAPPVRSPSPKRIASVAYPAHPSREQRACARRRSHRAARYASHQRQQPTP